MKKSLSFAALAAFSVFLLSERLPAADQITPGACKADVQKLCAGVQPGDGRIMQCMKQHESELSDACKQNIAIRKTKRKERVSEFRAACADDAKRFCADVAPGGGRKIACLRRHQSELSPTCQQALAPAGGQSSAAAAPPPAPASSSGAPAGGEDAE